MWKRLKILDFAFRDAKADMYWKKTGLRYKSIKFLQTRPHATVEVIYCMMNRIVVSLMKSCDEKMERERKKRKNNNYRPIRELVLASEEALISYCLLFHLYRSDHAIPRDATCKAISSRSWRLDTNPKQPI